MKYVVFSGMPGADGKIKDLGEVRLVDGSLEFSDDGLREFLESTAVFIMGKVYWPWDDDKEQYLSLLPLAFRGTAFRASLVMERDTDQGETGNSS